MEANQPKPNRNDPVSALATRAIAVANRDEQFKAQLRQIGESIGHGNAQRILCALTEAYAEWRSDEREQWLPLAGELRARILHKRQFGGTVLLSLEDVLAISCELKIAERRTA